MTLLLFSFLLPCCITRGRSPFRSLTESRRKQGKWTLPSRTTNISACPHFFFLFYVLLPFVPQRFKPLQLVLFTRTRYPLRFSFLPSSSRTPYRPHVYTVAPLPSLSSARLASVMYTVPGSHFHLPSRLLAAFASPSHTSKCSQLLAFATI